MPSLFKHILLSLAVFCGCVKGIPVLTMDPSVIPEDNATAEILNTKTNTLDNMTICGRFRTPHLPFLPNPLQNLIYIKDMWLLYMLDFRNCERSFKGCTKYYQNCLGNLQNSFIDKDYIPFQEMIGCQEIQRGLCILILHQHILLFHNGNQMFGIHFVFQWMLQIRHTG